MMAGEAGVRADGMSLDLAGRIFRQLMSFLVSLIMTFLGLTAVTFLIGRLTRIDPVLAVVGDKASKQVYDQAYIALGLDEPLLPWNLTAILHRI
jgi:ABC-type dipeptide/oligopeptide/nickel transport system permease component